MLGFRSIRVTATLIGLAMAVTTSASAFAATMLYRDVEDLVEISDVIVLGEVVDSRVFVGSFGRISTEWTVRVDSTLMGSPRADVRFVQWGGTLDGITERVPGDARFVIGERAVFFLVEDESGRLYLSALAQSKFTIVDSVSPHRAAQVLRLPPPLARSVAQLAGDPQRPRLEVALVEPVAVRDLAEVGIYSAGVEGARVVEGGAEVLRLSVLVERIADAVSQEAR